MPSMIEWHRHQRVPLLRPGVTIKGLGQPMDELRVVVILVLVLEAKHRLADLATGQILRARPLEMPPMFRAIVANEGRVELVQRWVRIATLAAEWRLDADRRGLGADLAGKGQVQGAFAPVPGVVSGCTEGCR